MWEYNRPRSSEELYHFGVLGMKWGVRRSIVKDPNIKALKKQLEDDKKVSNRAIREHGRVGSKMPTREQRAKSADDMISKIDKTAISAKKYKDAYDAARVKEIDKLSRLADREKQEGKEYFRKQAVDNVVNKIKNLTIGVLSAAAIAEGQSYLLNHKFINPFKKGGS